MVLTFNKRDEKMKLENIKIKQDLSEEEIVKIACKKNNIKFSTVKNYRIIKKSVDARDKANVHYNYSIEINEDGNNQEGTTNFKEIKKVTGDKNAVIVGAGPAGLFCALTLLQNGIKPIIVEQGKRVEDRQKDIDEFIKKGKLNLLSNVQFGEGGAGTFSDGKLTSGLHNPLCKKVIQTFIEFGAPKEIKYINKPHIGTDNLINIIKNIREYILEKGGQALK